MMHMTLTYNMVSYDSRLLQVAHQSYRFYPISLFSGTVNEPSLPYDKPDQPDRDPAHDIIL